MQFLGLAFLQHLYQYSSVEGLRPQDQRCAWMLYFDGSVLSLKIASSRKELGMERKCFLIYQIGLLL